MKTIISSTFNSQFQGIAVFLIGNNKKIIDESIFFFQGYLIDSSLSVFNGFAYNSKSTIATDGNYIVMVSMLKKFSFVIQYWLIGSPSPSLKIFTSKAVLT